MLQIKNFGKTYSNGKRAVDNISITVEKGDLFGFIGHNGAGKSTTIKSVVGVLDFTEGDILVDGISVKENPIACKEKLAYIPDNPELYDHLTGIQYLNFIADIFNVDTDTRRKIISKYSDIFGISNDLNTLISSYSHGMKQKLAIISALVHSPKLLILDEPFVGLDPKAALELKNIFKDICNNGGAIFFSTHVLEVAQKLCNKIAIINGGKIVKQGVTEELLQDKSLEEMFMEVVEGVK